MRTHLNRCVGVLRVTEQGVRLLSVALFIKVTEGKSTTSAFTAQGVWIGYQLVSCLSMQTGYGSLLGIN